MKTRTVYPPFITTGPNLMQELIPDERRKKFFTNWNENLIMAIRQLKHK